ncbi:ABC transporter ATP-binding protein [Ideonella sp.]|uniref:ABC transporter ATP-binding protein n=1 Tax=Ideonella sp. TaxID=1929293 RepID=UPI003BB69C68
MAGVQLEAVGKAYDGGVQVIRDVNLDIADGEFCVFVGPSGCGKSTLLRMIAGLEDISSGEARIGGLRVNELAPSERNVAMVFQNYALYPHMDVAANLGFGLRLSGCSRAEATAKVQNVAKMLQIDGLLTRKPKELSGGQRQRVAIGRALVRDPGVFLFDEPLSNLDAALRTQTRLEIARLHRQHGRASTIYVTHDQVEAMTLADRMVLMQPGQPGPAGGSLPSVAQVGAPLDLYNEPCNLFVAGFLGSPKMNLIPATVSALAPNMVGVRLAQGGDVAVAVQPGTLAVGDAVTLGVRAEHLRLAAEPGPNRIACRVQWQEHLGDLSYAYLSSGDGTQIVLRLLEPQGTRVGDAVQLELPAEHGHLFDASGQALRRCGKRG